MKHKLLLFIPMYNCEKQITRVLRQLTPVVLPYIAEVLIVNNRSDDQGEQAVMAYLETHTTQVPVKLLRNDRNYGLGGSHKVAFQYAIAGRFDYVAVLHGDDQGQIADLLPVLQTGAYEKYDCCLGSRFLKASKLVGYSHFRTVGNQAFNLIFSAAIGKRIYDLGAGLNLYAVAALQNRYYEKFPDNLTFNCYMLFAMAAYRQTHMFFPITWREEDQISNVKMTKQAWQTLKMAVAYGIRREKMLQKDAREQVVEGYTSTMIYSKDVQVT